MNPAVLLHWHYLIFLAPFGLSAMLLLLSSLRLGHHHGTGAGHAHAAIHVAHPGHIAAGHAGAAAVPAAHGHGHGNAADTANPHSHSTASRHGQDASKAGTRNGVPQPFNILGLVGARRAPLPMVVEAFFLVWGLAGCISNQLLLKHVLAPGLLQVLPSIGIAAAVGFVGSRVAAEMISRLMPDDESQVVSREGLFGLKGTVAFPVSETGGRIMIYDDFGSLHDESCRVVPGHAPIERGRRIMVMDRDQQGNLMVEEIPE